MKTIIRRQLPAVALTVVLTIVFLFFGVNRAFYASTLINVFYCVILAVCALLLFAVRPWTDAVPVLACTGALAVTDFLVLRFVRPPLLLVPLLSLFGLSCLFVLGLRTIWAPAGQRRFLLYAFVPGLLFAISEYSATTMLELTGRLHPQTFDLYIYSFEASLGAQLSFLLGQTFTRFPWWRLANIVFYVAVPVPMVMAYAGQLKARGKAALPVFLAILIAGPLGILCFNLFPAGGPINMLRASFPRSPLTMAQAARLLVEPIRVGGWRNAIPSLHMTWVLLAWWNAPGLARWRRILIGVFVVFTITSTMGTGEHWFVDLVVAFPFALMIQALARYDVGLREGRRWVALAAGLLMTLGWFALLRFATPLWWISPLIGWTAVLATVVGCLLLVRRLTPTWPPRTAAGSGKQRPLVATA